MASILAKTGFSSTIRHTRLVRDIPFRRSQGRVQPVFQHNLPQHVRQSTRARSKRATEDDERLIEEMKLAAEKGDLLEGSAVDVILKVLAVSTAVGLVVVLAYLAQPVIQNTVASFPSAS